MTRFKLTFLVTILLPLNFLSARHSLTTWNPNMTVTCHEPVVDSMDVSTFIQLSRKEFELYVGHDLNKQERRAFRKAKRDLRRQMASEGKSKWWIGIVIGGGLILAGLMTVFFGVIKDSECEDPPYCEDGDTEKAIGNGLIIGGVLVGVTSIFLNVKSKKEKSKQ